MWRNCACLWVLIGLLGPPVLAEGDYVPDEGLRAVNLLKTWQLRLPLDPGQRLVDVYLVDDMLYAATNDGYVFAMHAETGASRWLRQITREGFRMSRPCHAGDRVIFATPTTVLQLDQYTGEGRSKSALPFTAGTGPISDGQRYFIGGLDQRLYAYDVTNPLYGWRVIADGPIMSSPVLSEGDLIFASSEGTVYSCTADQKRFRWRATTYGSVTADLAVNEHGVYVANRDQSLYLLDPHFGRIRWRARFSGPLYEPPVLTSELAYQYCPGHGLAAVETATLHVDERLRWVLPRGRKLLTVDSGTAYVLSLDETILAVAVRDGAITHTLPAPGMTLCAPRPDRPFICVAAPDGRIFCAQPRGAPWVTRANVRSALTPPEPTTQPAEGPTTQPVRPEPKEVDRLPTSQTGPPAGGKSRVSRDFGRDRQKEAAGPRK